MNDILERIGTSIGLFMIYVFLISFTIGGLIGTGFGVRQLYLANQSRYWSTTSGTIIYSDIRVIENEENSANNSYQPVVKYSYQVNDSYFTSDRILFGTLFFRDIIQASKILELYPVNQEVTVYYDSDYPQDSVLEAGLTKKSFVPVTAGVFIFTLFATVTVLIWSFN